MAELDLDAIQAAAEKATPGPWKVWALNVLADPVGESNLDDGLLVARTYSPGSDKPRTFNADFIAAARGWIPALVGEVRQLRNRRTELERDEEFPLWLVAPCRIEADAADPDECGEHVCVPGRRRVQYGPWLPVSEGEPSNG